MHSPPSLNNSYAIIYYPPKSEKSDNQHLLITILSVVCCIALIPGLLILLTELNELFAFLIGAGCAGAYFLVVQPMLVKKAGDKTEIHFSPEGLRIQHSDGRESIHLLKDYSLSFFEYSGSDEASVATIHVGFADGSELTIHRRYALEGDFEELLKELKRQIGNK